MTIETVELPTGGLVRFNGTTEWALDSIAQAEVIWLPHRGPAPRPARPGLPRASRCVGDGLAVEAAVDGEVARFVDIDAERAYARALLALLSSLDA